MRDFQICINVPLKHFDYNRVGVLDSPWCNNFCCTYQALDQGDFYSFDQEMFPFFNLFTTYSHKKIVTTKNSWLPQFCL